MARSLRSAWLPPAVALAAAVLGAAAYTLIAYRFSPIVALAVPFGLAAVAAIFWNPTLGIYVSLLAVPLEFLRFRAGGAAKLSPAEIVLLLSGASAVGHMLLSAERRRLGAPHVAFGALLAVVAAGVVFAEKPSTVAKSVVMWSMLLALSVWVASADRRELRTLLAVIGGVGGIVGLIAVLHGGSQELVAGGSVVTNRAQAGFDQPNLLAFFLVLALPVALVTGMRGAALVRLPLLLATGLAFAGLLLTLSRGGIIGTAVALVVLLLWTAFRRVFAGLLVLLVIFAALNANPLAKSTEVSVVQQRLATIVGGQETTTNPRIGIWKKTPSIVADHFVLGVGVGDYSVVAPRYGLVALDGSPYEHAHNLFLTFAAETGLVGLAAFVWFVVAVARTALSTLGRRTASDFPLALGLVAALTGLLATGMTDYPLRANVVMALIMLEVGALVGYARVMRAGDPRAPVERAVFPALTPPTPRRPNTAPTG